MPSLLDGGQGTINTLGVGDLAGIGLVLSVRNATHSQVMGIDQ